METSLGHNEALPSPCLSFVLFSRILFVNHSLPLLSFPIFTVELVASTKINVLLPVLFFINLLYLFQCLSSAIFTAPFHPADLSATSIWTSCTTLAPKRWIKSFDRSVAWLFVLCLFHPWICVLSSTHLLIHFGFLFFLVQLHQDRCIPSSLFCSALRLHVCWSTVCLQYRCFPLLRKLLLLATSAFASSFRFCRFLFDSLAGVYSLYILCTIEWVG